MNSKELFISLSTTTFPSTTMTTPKNRKKFIDIVILVGATLAFIAGNLMSPVLANPVAIGRAAVSIGLEVADTVKTINGNDNQKREAFTKGFVSRASQQHPNYNVVISHNGGEVWGVGVTHQHIEVPMTVGTVGYEAYFAPKGKPFKFVRKGDGGYINWAFGGNFQHNGATIIAR